MPRSGAQARARLREAALELYRELGYEATTTAQIAARAGVTERTYFRHFADKREVLFDGEGELVAVLTAGITGAPADEGPLDAVVRGYRAAVPLLVANRPMAERRAEVIAATPALQERAAAKSASLTDAVAQAVVSRGVEPATARLAAQIGSALFERAAEAWRKEPTRDLGSLIEEAVHEVRELA
jgi:AcrR family transcriptional regulator